jgi:alpha-N-arabinofuranosidase
MPSPVCLLLAVCVIVPNVLSSALWGADEARITIDPATIIGPVNPRIFGNNISCAARNDEWTHSNNTGNGAWNPVTHRPREDYMRFSKEMGVKASRYPSGSDAEKYVWTEYVGPKETRPARLFGIAEWIAWCREAGAEPVFTLNAHMSPQEAADLVDYLNGPADDKHPWAKKRAAWGHPEPFRVTYFELGNETYFDRKRFPADGLAYANWAKSVDQAMKARVDWVRTGLVVKFNWGSDSTEWNDSVFRKVQPAGDFAIHHTYPNAFDGDDYYDLRSAFGALMMGSEQWGALYRKIHDDIKSMSGRDMPIAITEFNGFFNDANTPHSHILFSYANAFFCGDLTREMLLPSNNVIMANYFITSYLQVAGGNKKTFLEGAETTWKRLPAYFIFRLWGQHTGVDILSSTIDAPRMKIKSFGLTKATEGSVLSAIASRRTDGTICLMVFNRNMDKDVGVTISLKDDTAVTSAKYWQVTSPSLVNTNPLDANMETVSGQSLSITNNKFTCTLPMFSMTAFELKVVSKP